MINDRERQLPPLPVVVLRVLPIAVMVGIACAVIAGVISGQREDQYRGTALLLLRPVGADPAVPETAGQIEEGEGIATNVLLVSRPGVLRRVSERPEITLTPREIADSLEVTGVEETNILRVTATTRDAQQAAAVATGVAEEFVDIRLTAARARTRQARRVLSDQLERLGPRARETEAGLRLRDQIEALRVREELGAQAPQVVQEAAAPLEPVSPRPARDAALAGLFGFILGGGLGLLRIGSDRRLAGADEVREAMAAPLLVVVPRWRALRRGRRRGKFPKTDTQGFRLLHLRLRDRNGAGAARTVAVTSAGPDDEADVAAWHLAAAASATDDRVLLVECPASVNDAGLAENVRPVSVDGQGDSVRFDVLTAGDAGRQDGDGDDEAQSGRRDRFQEVLREASGAYDMVVVQTPNVVDDAGAAHVLQRVDGVVVTARHGRLDADRAEALRSELEVLGTPVLAVVVDGE